MEGYGGFSSGLQLLGPTLLEDSLPLAVLLVDVQAAGSRQGSLITAQLHPLGQVWILPDLAENRLAKLAGVEKFDDLQEIVVAWPSSAPQQCSNVRLAGTFQDISVKNLAEDFSGMS